MIKKQIAAQAGQQILTLDHFMVPPSTEVVTDRAAPVDLSVNKELWNLYLIYWTSFMFFGNRLR